MIPIVVLRLHPTPTRELFSAPDLQVLADPLELLSSRNLLVHLVATANLANTASNSHGFYDYQTHNQFFGYPPQGGRGYESGLVDSAAMRTFLNDASVAENELSRQLFI
jgi:hypothetical protein